MEKQITFLSGPLEISGLFEKRPGDQAVIVTHPHPLYGGEMRNPVVEAARDAFYENGRGTLRFNFRGVGASQGTYDEGKGEQNDVRAAQDCLLSAGFTHITAAGYSFGAWVNAMAASNGASFSDMIMISPPVAMMDFDGVSSLPGLGLVISGSEDEIAPPGLIRDMLERWNSPAELKIIEGADHFYSGRMRDLERAVSKYLAAP
ncbi:conserved hypothetical protein [Candidatus Desulfarcum epimagneticum]|uniref:Alpha/beta hydrolase n=1 Tax=uncultured Desulfobacteraceae bacterium TaxID=218296 RepID=A0A484HDN1_9BACT|nr:conserved hypothetical protein [uncultured Desulfobacteraceae bacterium]